MVCKNCGRELKENAAFCTYCGTEVEKNHFCACCGNNINIDAMFCPHCGTPVKNEKEHKQENKENTEVELKDETAEVIAYEKKKGNKKGVLIAVLTTIIVVAVIVISVFVSEYMSTKDMREALETNNAYLINEIYANAWDDTKLLDKYDELITEKLDNIIENINAQDFSEQAKTSSDEAFEEYLYVELGDFIDFENFSETILSKYYVKLESLYELIESKESYYLGIYDYYAGDYESAVNYFSDVIETDSNFTDAETYMADSIEEYISVLSTDAQALIDSGDIAGGIELLTSAKEYIDSYGIDSTEINDMINSTFSTYAAQYAEKAEVAFNERDINSAIGNIEVALELQPDNAEYKAKLDTYKMYLPVELFYEKNVLFIEENGAYFADENEIDITISNDNTEMYNTMGLYYNCDFASLTYNLNGLYDYVSGTVFVKNSKKSESGEGYFEAYGDGKLIYTSPKMHAGVLPQIIEFDISGVHKLTIKMYGQKHGMGLEISNLIAQKAFPEQ